MSEQCSACGSSPLEQVRSLYADLALHPERDFGWGKGRENARALGYDEEGLARLPDACADVVISNGAINLSPSKPCVLKEAFRVLKPGGRFQIADMVRDAGSCEAHEVSGDNWAGCVAGTLLPDDLLKLIREAGFREVELVGLTGYRTSPSTIGAHFRATKPQAAPPSTPSMKSFVARRMGFGPTSRREITGELAHSSRFRNAEIGPKTPS